MVEELVHAPPRSKRDTPPVDAVRGFVFLSGLRWMEKQGVAARFRKILDADVEKEVVTLTTSQWVPLDISLKAYAACDALGLSMDEQIDLGRAVSRANNGVVIETLTRLIGKVVSPWTALGHLDRVWQRSNRGGAVAVYKLGERMARLEFWQVPLAQSPFFVTSMRGAIAVGLDPFCEKLVISEIPELTTKDFFALRVMW
jgi:hypothetical protein